MKKTYVSIGLALFILGAFGALSFFLANPPTAVYRDTDHAYNREYWRQEIEYRGPAYAYQEFQKRNLEAPKRRQHFAAHVMGTILYEKLGLSGIVVCDDAFAFGCYHGFSSYAIAERGERAIDQLTEICISEFGPISGCQHGIGHGILEYAGYDDLPGALRMCESLVYQPTPLIGCTSGVFMEYFTPLSGGSPVQLEHYRFDPQAPYVPCPNVADRFKRSCYFELGQALRQTEGSDYFSVCGKLSGKERQACFLGVGTDLARIPDPHDVLTRCRTLSPEDELYCRAGAAWGYASENLERSWFMCMYEDYEKKTACVRAADITEGIDPPLVEPAS